MFDLTGKTALVTGASGGIGAAIARGLHAQGATVALSGTRAEALEKLAGELVGRTHILTCNLSDKDAVEKLVPGAEAAMGQLDILVNNAGISGSNATVADYPVDELIRKDAFESAWPTLAETQNAGTQKTTDAPVLLIHSTGDDLIPVSHAETLRQRMCDNQQIVELRLINAGGHGRAGLNAYEHALAWIEGQFRGEPPTNGCPEPR